MSTIDSFNSAEHIDFRNSRYFKIDKTNQKLLGLSTVEINPTELCNRTCSFCPRHDSAIYPNRNLNMTVETAALLKNQLIDAGFTGDIHITGFGEPLLNPVILNIIKVFSSNFFTELITNGDRLLNNYYTHQQLSNVGLQSLIIDCYDGTEQYLKVKDLLQSCSIPYRIRNHHDTGESSLIEIYNFNNRGGILSKVKSLQKACWLPFYKMFVDWNGDILLCCNDWSRNITIGNIYNKSIDKIWTSEQFIQIRKHLDLGNRSNVSACANCSVNGTLQGSQSRELWKEKI